MTIGFIHDRNRLKLDLPPGSRLFRQGELLRPLSGRLEIRLLESRPARGRNLFKLLESPRQEWLERIADDLTRKGHACRLLPFAPGYDDGRVFVPSTWLLALEKRSLDGAELDRHQATSRHGDLWHQGSLPDVFQAEKPAEARVRLNLEDGVLEEALPGLQIDLPPGECAEVDEVEIGIGFHWEHRRPLRYPDRLRIFLNHEGRLGLANELELDHYLCSVNSSEMTADCPPELLKAQTIAARSTLLATRGRHHFGEAFDICADDHCQCYRGEETIAEASRLAVSEAAGMLLCHDLDGKAAVCDARYSKSCGGIVEAYENVWEDTPVGYMTALCDTPTGGRPPSRGEDEWRAFLEEDEREAWCNTDHDSLPAGLEHCEGLYRWQVRMSREEAAGHIRRACGLDFETLLDLEPVERGASGRLIRLDVLTDRGRFRIGKELVIRKALSESHLYSALIAFDWEGDTLVIRGKGWGHGVGMCQLGATRMAAAGHSAARILEHYYPGTFLSTMEAASNQTGKRA